MMSLLPAFETAVGETDGVLAGPWRQPRQMLAEQEYGGHASIHDDATARKLGFKGGTIEGPTHFSQFAPLGFAVWGKRWFAEGGLSVQYRAAVYEGETVRAFMDRPGEGQSQTAVWMERDDGTEILRGTASVGTAHPPSAVQAKLDGLSGGEPWVILRDVAPGMTRPRVSVAMDADTKMGRLYPFSLEGKLAVITEPSPWFRAGADNPWGRAIIPLEMVSVLLNHLASEDPWTLHGPTVDLFTDQEIVMQDGPLFVGETYEIERAVVARSATRRTEALWVKTSVFRPGDDRPVATMLLSTASLKDSYAEYEADLASLA
ncbi:MAG: hypothetical protein JWP35_2005 [Caulobacter sp.]|nr:hypothetical protein [Caulobacter sp.]